MLITSISAANPPTPYTTRSGIPLMIVDAPRLKPVDVPAEELDGAPVIHDGSVRLKTG